MPYPGTELGLALSLHARPERLLPTLHLQSWAHRPQLEDSLSPGWFFQSSAASVFSGLSMFGSEDQEVKPSY